MSFKDLQVKVTRAEAALEARERETAADLRVFGGIWRAGWTAPRILVAGLASGLLVGWLRGGPKIAGAEPARWLQIAGSIAGLVGSLQAAFAAGHAQDAARDAGEVAETASANAATAGAAPVGAAGTADMSGKIAGASIRAPAPRPPAPDRGRRPDPAWDTPPRPAEAATEVSEHR